MHAIRKRLGQFFTPPDVAEALVKWVAPQADETILDPSCGDGEFLRCHQNAVGVDVDEVACDSARENAPRSDIIRSDFFQWASQTDQRFEAAVGNPPFVRYQRFNGEVRDLALFLSGKNGARISRLTSTWAPFIVVASSLLKPKGRMAFVVPAEIGHSTYAKPVIQYLAEHFRTVHLVAIREKIFPDLSTDAWLLFANGFGGHTSEILLTVCDDAFVTSDHPPKPTRIVSLLNLAASGYRFRKYLLDADVLDHYEQIAQSDQVITLADVATVKIGYVTGDNAFFHLTRQEVEEWSIPTRYLKVSLRNGRSLPPESLSRNEAQKWVDDGKEVHLLDLTGVANPPPEVKAYLESDAGITARRRYKCRVRNPWYIVPDVTVPDAFISCMSGREANFALNDAGCVCTNSVLAVFGKDGVDLRKVAEGWQTPLSRLSQELEGHPLGGGLLKIEPREAQRIVVPIEDTHNINSDLLNKGIVTMRRWRHINMDTKDKSGS